MSAAPSVSVAVRSRDEAPFVSRVLESIARQNVRPLEVVYVDDHSTDGTPALVEARAGARVVRWGEEAWSYARHTNRAIAECHGEIVVCLVGHAVPIGEDWLQRLIAPFAAPEVAGVYGRQLPYPGCNLLEVRRLDDSYGPEPKVQRDEPFFSTSHCAVRRSMWEQVPFDETLPFGEDAVWAAEVQRRGYAVVYEPAARALHSHDAGPRLLLRRAFQEGRGLSRIYPRSILHLLRKTAARWLKGARADFRLFRAERAAAWRYPFAFGFELVESITLHAGVVRGWIERPRGRQRGSATQPRASR